MLTVVVCLDVDVCSDSRHEETTGMAGAISCDLSDRETGREMGGARQFVGRLPLFQSPQPKQHQRARGRASHSVIVSWQVRD